MHFCIVYSKKEGCLMENLVLISTIVGISLVTRGSRFWGNHKEVTWKHFLKLGAGLAILTRVFYYTEYLLGPSFGVPVGINALGLAGFTIIMQFVPQH